MIVEEVWGGRENRMCWKSYSNKILHSYAGWNGRYAIHSGYSSRDLREWRALSQRQHGLTFDRNKVSANVSRTSAASADCSAQEKLLKQLQLFHRNGSVLKSDVNAIDWKHIELEYKTLLVDAERKGNPSILWDPSWRCSYHASLNLSLLQLPSSIELKENAPIHKCVDSQLPSVAPQYLSNDESHMRDGP